MRVSFFYSVLILFSCISCEVNSGAAEALDVGEFDKSGKETGVWLRRDSSGQLLEKGKFDSGLMIGNWEYYKPIKDEWEWRAIRSPNGNIKTSLPEFIKIEENHDSLIIASSIDTAIGFTTVISNIPSLVSSLDEYTSSVFNDIYSLDIKIIDSVRQIIETTKGQDYVFHQILCLKPNNDTVRVFNMATIIDKKKLMEITVRCENRLQLFGRRTFYSILPHTFINDKRFVEYKDEMKKTLGRREF